MSLAVVAADWRGATLRGAQVVHVPWATLRAAAYQEDRVLREAYARAYVGALVLRARNAVDHYRGEPVVSSCGAQRNGGRDEARGNAERAIAHALAEIEVWRKAERRRVEERHAVADRIAAGDLNAQADRAAARARERRGVSGATAWLSERTQALDECARVLRDSKR